MGLFSGPEEIERKARLKALEDKRLTFAQAMSARGFKPEKMLFAQSPNGSIVAACHFEGKRWLVIGPGFGTDEEFVLECFESTDVRREDVTVKAEGMGGIFGFGKKGERGVEYVVTRADGSEVRVPFVYGRNGWGEYALNKNPLLGVKRRRGDANIAWEMKPIETTDVDRIISVTDSYFL